MNCERCNEPIDNRNKRFCSARCYGDSMVRPSAELAQPRMRYAPKHPLARSNGQVPDHRAVLFASIGPGEHPCHWCSKPVVWTKGRLLKNDHLVVDHLDDDWRNNDLTNLVPSCSLCNSNRAMTRGVRDDEVFVTRKNGTRLRGVVTTCVVCGVTFTTPKKHSKSTCGRVCGWKLAAHSRTKTL